MEDIVCIMPKDILKKINFLIMYNWSDEMKNFEESMDVQMDEHEKWRDNETGEEIDIHKIGRGHVFLDLLAIDEFIQGLDKPNKTNPFTKEDWVTILETAKNALTDNTTIEIMAEEMDVDESVLSKLGSKLEKYMNER